MTGSGGNRRTPRLGGRVVLVLALLLFQAACGKPEEASPVPDSTMVDMLIELHLSVARAEVTNSVPANIRDSILTAYEVDSTAYAEAVTYLAEHPDKYAEIYSRVLDKLNSERIPLGFAPEAETAPSSAPPSRSMP